MSEHSDEKMRSILRKKLSQVKVSTDDLKWEDIESRISFPTSRKTYYWSIAAAASILIVITMIFYNLESQNTSDISPQTASRPNVEQQTTDPKTNDSEEREPEKREQTQSKPVPSPVAEDINIPEFDSKVEGKAEKPIVEKNPSIEQGTDNEFAQNLLKKSSIVPNAVDLQTVNRDIDRNGLQAFSTGYMGERASVSDLPIQIRSSSSIFSHLSFGISPIMKFDFIRPKRTDFIYLEEFHTPSGLSTNRLGAHLFVSVDIRLSNKWYISTGGFFAFQRYELAYRYTDLIDRQTTSEKLSSVGRSLGSQLGLKRLIKQNSPINKYFTVSAEYQKSLTDNVNLSNEGLIVNVGYEIRRQINHSLSLSLQPTVSYSFSYTENDLFRLKPYWFGIRLGVNRNFLK